MFWNKEKDPFAGWDVCWRKIVINKHWYEMGGYTEKRTWEEYQKVLYSGRRVTLQDGIEIYETSEGWIPIHDLRFAKK